MTTEGSAAEGAEEGAHKAPVSSQERDYDAEAREDGWRPKEEWTGKPENWKDAKTWVERGDTHKRLSTIEERIEKEVSARVSKMEKVTEATIARLTKAHQQDIANLKAARREAVKEGNVDLVEQYDEAIEKQQSEAPLTDDPKAERDKAEQAFANAHPWYGTNRKMTAFARGISQDLAASDPNMTFENNIKAVLVAVQEEFPEYFNKPAANGHAAVDGGSDDPSPAPKAGSLFAKLPPEAKAQAAKDVKAGHYKTTEEWAKVYLQ